MFTWSLALHAWRLLRPRLPIALLFFGFTLSLAVGVAPLSAQSPVHIVQPGETLTQIAVRYGVSLEALMQANQISEADRIFSGQQLMIPLPAPSARSVNENVMKASGGEAGGVESASGANLSEEIFVERSGNTIATLNRPYQVRTGDTLAGIALRFGVDADALRRLNRFPSLNAPLRAGQQILLPATGEDLRPHAPNREHRVQAGETLGKIAAAYGVTLAALLQANRIADPNTVYVGQLLTIPSDASEVGVASRQIGPPRNGFFYYTVQPGDTMSTIARNLNTTMLAIQTYNDLPDAETVYNNMQLKIPYGPPPIDQAFPPVPMSGTRFVVSISRQQCWVYQGERVVYAWPCSTGAGERRTKPGNYAVQSKILNAKSKVWKLDMPYWLGIYDVGPYENGIHGLPVSWQTGKKIWSGLIGQPATFGCAMLGDLEASILFRMAYIGMPVHVLN
ncbi:MAG: LysM peptidoglycan-binding domain-containing protein [Anaerolineales bacterium]|nr:LysM peptidoglycan-binding domain-containing protein [Anaerolineales bacterium]MDW8446989.1 LysM peptidoglycan-binding domain-containing protein [Anaerolineales bacterium]